MNSAQLVTASEQLSLSLSADLGREGTQPATFAELVQLFDVAMNVANRPALIAPPASIRSVHRTRYYAHSVPKGALDVVRLAAGRTAQGK
jgi:hypothetical protein